jgi:microcystin-dependent protein
MSTITTIQPTDVIANSRADINTNFENLNTDKVESLSDLGVSVTSSQINTVVSRDVVLPSGVIFITAGTALPDGWLRCQGQAVSRTTYADLFTAIGTTYGVGDGSTTFNVPNLQGRVPVELDSSQTEFDTLGETGGAKTHTLTVEQIPAHSHDYSVGTGGTSGSTQVDTQTRFNTSSYTTQNAGGGEAHNNLQPYIVLRYIIKI